MTHTPSYNEQDRMIRCDGCGSHVEKAHVCNWPEYHEQYCIECARCTENPGLREAYKRGFNAGLDAMAKTIAQIAETSGLRRR